MVEIDFHLFQKILLTTANHEDNLHPAAGGPGRLCVCQNRFVLFLFLSIEPNESREPYSANFHQKISRDVIVLISCGFLASRELLDAQDDINKAFSDAQEDINGFFASFWGKKCVVNDNCLQHMAYCDKDAGITGLDGECRPNIWVWLVLAVIALLLVGSCVCCIICGLCKCLYNCLCCCCRDKGYTPANTA